MCQFFSLFTGTENKQNKSSTKTAFLCGKHCRFDVGVGRTVTETECSPSKQIKIEMHAFWRFQLNIFWSINDVF